MSDDGLPLFVGTSAYDHDDVHSFRVRQRPYKLHCFQPDREHLRVRYLLRLEQGPFRNDAWPPKQTDAARMQGRRGKEEAQKVVVIRVRVLSLMEGEIGGAQLVGMETVATLHTCFAHLLSCVLYTYVSPRNNLLHNPTDACDQCERLFGERSRNRPSDFCRLLKRLLPTTIICSFPPSFDFCSFKGVKIENRSIVYMKMLQAPLTSLISDSMIFIYDPQPRNPIIFALVLGSHGDPWTTALGSADIGPRLRTWTSPQQFQSLGILQGICPPLDLQDGANKPLQG